MIAPDATLLVTGGAGFIGSALVRLLLRETGHRVVVLDALTYAGRGARLATLQGHERLRFVRGDVGDAALVEELFAEEGFGGVLHLAAESHVDRSIQGPAVFVRTNVLGTQVLLDAARQHGVQRFVQISTDEVYGALGPDGAFSETSPLRPSSPYSASKAGADLLALAAHHTFGLPVCLTRGSNTYGPWQHPEKLIPVMIAAALDGRPLPVYGDGSNVREWMHVDDHCRGILATLRRGRPGRSYNLGSGVERSNLAVVHQILDLLGAPRGQVSFIADRPGHDWRYAVETARARDELGWQPQREFDAAFAETIRWYVDHADWWRPLREADGA